MSGNIDLIQRMTNDAAIYFKGLQQTICDSLSVFESNAKFIKDEWKKTSGLQGEGITCVLQDGQLFEQIAVNFSHVKGDKLPSSAQNKRDDLRDASFEATGVSIIIHPFNPYVPTVHMNVRYFCATKPNGEIVWWFGGGSDLTPYYGFEEDCVYWHQTLKDACEPFGKELYADFKQACDDYFYLSHRSEHRGIGGIFFDNYTKDGCEDSLAFVKSVGDHFLKGYLPIVTKRKDHSFDVQQKAFQLMRRGRYVEFNLLYDRGTLFGLQSGGRVESILASLPPQVIWQYDWQPSTGSVEDRLTSYFLIPQDWANYKLEMMPA